MDQYKLSKILLDIHPLYLSWREVLDKEVKFRNKDTRVHGRDHCSRVLVLALVLGQAHQVDRVDMEALAQAAVFHDAQRMDDGLDRGHGFRGAAYYEYCCRSRGQLMDERTYTIIGYHDQADEDGLAQIKLNSPDYRRDSLLFKIFKDSDGLDRIRLGAWALDLSYLRTQPAPDLLPFAYRLLDLGPEEVFRAASQA